MDSVVARRSTALPLPSSPHWAPRTTIAGIGPPPARGERNGPARAIGAGQGLVRTRPYPTGGTRTDATWARVRPVDPLLVITNGDAGTADDERLDAALEVLRGA